ncbi:hypothetical protein D3C81_2242490 [compost metagenome]
MELGGQQIVLSFRQIAGRVCEQAVQPGCGKHLLRHVQFVFELPVFLLDADH